jgi:EAL domain-containing protein (putative c-di-GMP-specific phosphodiesterase class I)
MAKKKQSDEQAPSLTELDGELIGWEKPEERLREALTNDDLCLYYQPIVALRAPGGVAMAEMLVRLREEEELMLPPGDFLPAFEHFGMMGALDRWVLARALLRFGTSAGAVPMISVNASAQTLKDRRFAEFAAAQLRALKINPAALVMEIEEGDALDKGEDAARFSADIKGIGARVMLDGFGRRAMSFDVIRLLKLDYLKVDGAVTRKILGSEAAASKMKAIQRVGEMAGIGVVAECVEEEAVIGALRRMKIGYAQGFGVGKPEPIEKLFRK